MIAQAIGAVRRWWWRLTGPMPVVTIKKAGWAATCVGVPVDDVLIDIERAEATAARTGEPMVKHLPSSRWKRTRV